MDQQQLFLATEAGFVLAEFVDGQWGVARRSLNGRFLTSLMAREGFILAGSQDGIFSSADLGQTWQPINNGLTQRHIRWLAFHPDISDFELAGTEPAAIFLSQNGGESWQELNEVGDLRDQFGWWLPYSPEAGCVRGFAIQGERGFAAVEVGGLLRSDDGGLSWQLAGGSSGAPQFVQPASGTLHADVHSVAMHPETADFVYAPTGGGFYRSWDGGESWRGMTASGYSRAVWVDANDPDHLFIGFADNSSGRNGRLLRSQDGGETWLTPELSWSGNQPERLTQIGDRLFMVMQNGELYAAAIGTWQWEQILSETAGITAVAAMA